MELVNANCVPFAKATSKVKQQKNKLMGLVESEMKVKSEDQMPN